MGCELRYHAHEYETFAAGMTGAHPILNQYGRIWIEGSIPFGSSNCEGAGCKSCLGCGPVL